MFSGQELETTSIIIKNDGFWPDLDLAEFQVERAMAPNLNATLLRDALVSAVVEINILLEGYKTKQLKQGIDIANNIKVVSVGDISSAVIIYKKAVFARAKADLIGELTSISNRADKITENQRELYNELIAESSREVRKLLGMKRCGVALI